MKNQRLVDALELDADILEHFVEKISEDKLHRKRGDGIWTVYEHLHHITLVQPVMFKRIRMFKN